MRKPLKRAFRPCVDLTIWGLQLRLVPEGNLSEQRWALMPKHVDAQERRFLNDNLRDGDVFIDIGANVGLYTMWVASLPGRKVRVEAFEPAPELTERLERNRSRNKLEHVSLHDFALGRSESSGELRRNADNLGQNKIDVSRSGSFRIRPLHRSIEDMAIEKIHALKIDVEGSEMEVLEPFFASAPANLWPRWILCERLRNPETDPLGVLLTQSGYHLIERTRLNGIYQRDP